MSKTNAWKLCLAGMMAVALLATSPMFGPAARAADPVKTTIKITDNGFEPSTIDVEQGQAVEITFVWDHKVNVNDEHIITFEGYKVETEKLTNANKEATVKFVANNTGAFNFKCDIECDVHRDLQGGTLKVKAGGAPGSAASLQAAKLAIEPPGVAVKDGTVSFIASVADNEGKPISKATVQFLVEQKFAGTTGLVEVAQVKTGATGMASVAYQPTTGDAGKMVVRFAAQGVYDAAELAVNIPASEAYGTGFIADVQGLAWIHDIAPYALVSLILSVWTTFAFILYQAWGISRAGRTEHPTASLTTEGQTYKP